MSLYSMTVRAIYHLAGAMIILLLPSTNLATAQEAATIFGIVRSAHSAAPLSAVQIIVEHGSHLAITDHRGHYRLPNIPGGEITITAVRIGHTPSKRSLVLEPGATIQVDFELEEIALELADIVVSVDREARRRAETPATINILGSAEIRTTRATHPSEVMAQIPGAWVNATSGEGHMTAIRQPQTTAPVYLYLEDGVPTRSTGFFNHNALFEINLPQAGWIEVVKGPATALYGSDAIGATINIGVREPTSQASLETSVEGGAYGWGRFLLTTSGTTRGNGIRADLNLTRTDGWRDGTAYDRQTGTLRWDRKLGSATSLKVITTLARIDQATAGSSALAREDYNDRPRLNYTPISHRQVAAFRASAELRHLRPRSLLTLTTFARDNLMEMIPNWSLTYDPTIYTNRHRSLGLMARYRHDLGGSGARLTTGIDIDHSPGSHYEEVIDPTREGRIFTEYQRGPTIYDYDVTFLGISPYLQLEVTPAPGLHLSAGLRHDALSYDYETRLAPTDSGAHRRPPDSRLRYRHLSPKLGIAYEIADGTSLFAAYAHGFRAPSEGQLFRQGRAHETLALRPVRVDSYEGGLRGIIATKVRYELSLYQMIKNDDILAYTHPDGSVETMNAGRTSHQGIEAAIGIPLPLALNLDLTYTHALHRYESWRPHEGAELDGRSIEYAPRNLMSALLTLAPGGVEGPIITLEARRIGSYWMDPENTAEYRGHTLATLRAELPLNDQIHLFTRLTNLLDTHYAELATYTQARGEEYAPGMPRTLYLGLSYRSGEVGR